MRNRAFSRDRAENGLSVPNEFIVKVKKGRSIESAYLSLSTVFPYQRITKQTLSASSGFVRIQWANEFDLSAFHFNPLEFQIENKMEYLKRQDWVAYVEPNYLYFSDEAPSLAPSALFHGLAGFNDPFLPQQWGLEKSGFSQAMQLLESALNLDRDKVTKVRVAIIDSGIDANHDDLKDNIAEEISSNPLSNVLDDNGHGTHCAGTIGASAGNNLGIVGVNKNVELYPIKFLAANGRGSLAAVIQSIEIARAKKARVISASWSNNVYSRVLEEAVQGTMEDGIIWVASAGNDGLNNDVYSVFPANFDFENIISVAGTDSEGALVAQWPDQSNGSNFGPKSVHLAAPGLNVLSTFINNNYKMMNGTSAAVPFVAGTASLLLSLKPTLTPGQVRSLLVQTSEPTVGLKGKVASGGKLSVFSAVEKTLLSF